MSGARSVSGDSGVCVDGDATSGDSGIAKANPVSAGVSGVAGGGSLLAHPLPEWLRVPFVIGTFVIFGFVVLWAIRQRRR